MYADPALIRKNIVKLSLSDPEKAFLQAYCNITGGQLSVLVREMVMRQAVLVIHHQDSDSWPVEKPGASSSLIAA